MSAGAGYLPGSVGQPFRRRSGVYRSHSGRHLLRDGQRADRRRFLSGLSAGERLPAARPGGRAGRDRGIRRRGELRWSSIFPRSGRAPARSPTAIRSPPSCAGPRSIIRSVRPCLPAAGAVSFGPVRLLSRSRAVALRRPRAVPGRNGCKPPRGRPPLKGVCPELF